ncbi:MAG: dipeptidase [Anaerolineae bacterium]
MSADQRAIADLHCDLLLYLQQDPKRSAFDLISRCSIPQLKAGRVAVQTLAIFAETQAGSTAGARAQVQLYDSLLKDHPEHVAVFDRKTFQKEKRISLAVSIENASGFFEEDEPLEKGFERLAQLQKKAGQILYLSLTWNTENRFGGGNLTTVGLKEEGKALLEYLSEQNIAIDLSHTSDSLAEDILTHIDKKKLRLTPIASHSNFRSVQPHARNLPSDVASEIFRRGGIVGLNFVKKFVGEEFVSCFLKHVEKGLELGGSDRLCLGADFFYDLDSPSGLDNLKPFFFEEFSNSGCYPHVVQLLKQHFTDEQAAKISFGNFISWRHLL